MSSLPLADCQIEIQRGLTTSSTAIFIPFTTQELYQSGKESLYYGLNALSNNLIMVDRKKLKNPNGLILGTPGSGKSFSAKREIANAFLVTDDDIIVNDPEGEYSPLVNRLKGQVIKISPNSTQFINPMDINANYSEEDNPLSLKADFRLQQELWSQLEENIGHPNIVQMENFSDCIVNDLDLESGNVGIRDTLDEYWRNEYGFIKKLQEYIKEWIEALDTSRVVPRKKSLINSSPRAKAKAMHGGRNATI